MSGTDYRIYYSPEWFKDRWQVDAPQGCGGDSFLSVDSVDRSRDAAVDAMVFNETARELAGRYITSAKT